MKLLWMNSFFKPTKFKIYFSITITVILLLLLFLANLATDAVLGMPRPDNMERLYLCCSRVSESTPDCSVIIEDEFVLLNTVEQCQTFIQDYERQQLFNNLFKVAFVALFALISFLVAYLVASVLSFLHTYLKKR